MNLQVGDRVRTSGWMWRHESDRVGTVVEVYNGRSSVIGPGVELAAVQWDDTGRIERGYIVASGALTKIPSGSATPDGQA